MKRQDLLFILISSTFVVLLWIVFSVLHNAFSSTISESVAQDIVPIPGSFDTTELKTLKDRLQVTPQTGVNLPPTPTPTPTPKPVPTVQPIQVITFPLATQSSQTASQGGKTP